MRSSPAIVVLTLLLCAGVLGSAGGEEKGGFKFPDLNPFDNDSRATANRGVTARVSDESKSGLWFPTLPAPPALPKPKLPQLSMPSFKMPGSSNRGPSTWDRVSRNTKVFIGKTKTTLMPWTAPSQPKAKNSRVASRPSRESDSGLFSWFRSNDDEQKIQTVNDYLELPRPAP